METKDLPILTYETASPADHAALMRFYRALTGTEYCMWDDEYPDADETAEDLENGLVRCLRAPDGALAAVISVEPGDEEFNALPVWKNPGRCAVLARLGVAAACQGRGLARRMMEEVLADCKNAGCDGVRFIVHVDHAPAIALYRSLNVQFLGKASLYDLDWYCCELMF